MILPETLEEACKCVDNKLIALRLKSAVLNHEIDALDEVRRCLAELVELEEKKDKGQLFGREIRFTDGD